MGRPSFPPLLSETVRTGDDPWSDHLPLKLPEDSGHLDHGLAGGAGAVDGLLIGTERHSGSIQLGHGVGDVQDAPTKSVD
jgi:hypothetical protein